MMAAAAIESAVMAATVETTVMASTGIVMMVLAVGMRVMATGIRAARIGAARIAGCAGPKSAIGGAARRLAAMPL